MLFNHVSYPLLPLPPLAAVFLEGFQANEECSSHDTEGGKTIEEISYQRNCALWTGARQRVLGCGSANHADHAAKTLVVIDELDQLLEGTYSTGGTLRLDDDEREVLRKVRECAASLLRWHFDNGAGHLLPIARNIGLLFGSCGPDGESVAPEAKKCARAEAEQATDPHMEWLAEHQQMRAASDAAPEVDDGITNAAMSKISRRIMETPALTRDGLLAKAILVADIHLGPDDTDDANVVMAEAKALNVIEYTS